MLSTHGIIVLQSSLVPNGYILNGDNRAAVAALKRCGLEAYIVSDIHDIPNVPPEAYGERGIEAVRGVLTNWTALTLVRARNSVNSVADLIKFNLPLLERLGYETALLQRV